jgi:hypothetical protein
MEALFFLILVAFSVGLGAGFYFARVRSRLVYRAVVASIVVPASLFFVSNFGAYIINTNYFPHENHQQQLVWAYVSLSVAVIALLEAIFCFVPRMFKRAV